MQAVAPEDWDEWLQTNRVELNAMTSPQFVAFVEQKLREHGVSDIGEVSAAYMESDGEISVLQRKDGDSDKQKKRKAI
jgi:uncharacterized membrane protein YcaP (DUF421 family)